MTDEQIFQLLSVVIGAFLAVIGGIIGTVFTNFLNKHKEKREFKREAYTQLLNLLNSFETIDTVDVKEFQKENCETLTKMLLYSSSRVKEIYDIVLHLLKDKNENINDKETDKETIEALENYKVFLYTQMKIEMGCYSKEDRRIIRNYKRLKKKALQKLRIQKGKGQYAS